MIKVRPDQVHIALDTVKMLIIDNKGHRKGALVIVYFKDNTKVTLEFSSDAKARTFASALISQNL